MERGCWETKAILARASIAPCIARREMLARRGMDGDHEGMDTSRRIISGFVGPLRSWRCVLFDSRMHRPLRLLLRGCHPRMRLD